MADRGSFNTIARTSEEQRLIEQIASNSAFAKAPAIRKLLLYLWEQRDHDISEYAIAFDVLNKREHFDPKLDASVRVHLSRLRQTLREYFESEGAQSSFRAAVPQGTRRLQIEPVPRQPQSVNWTHAIYQYGSPVLTHVLACLCVFFWVRYESMRVELARIRSNIHRPDDLQQSEDLKRLIERLGVPAIFHSYTVSTDTMAAIQLTGFLSMHGAPLEVSPTETISFDQYGSDNPIFLGITRTNVLLGTYESRLNFRVVDGSGMVSNLAPRNAELALDRPAPSPKGNTATERYGGVAVLPGHAAGASLMLVVGAQTSEPTSTTWKPPTWGTLGRMRAVR